MLLQANWCSGVQPISVTSIATATTLRLLRCKFPVKLEMLGLNNVA